MCPSDRRPYCTTKGTCVDVINDANTIGWSGKHDYDVFCNQNRSYEDYHEVTYFKKAEEAYFPNLNPADSQTEGWDIATWEDVSNNIILLCNMEHINGIQVEDWKFEREPPKIGRSLNILDGWPLFLTCTPEAQFGFTAFLSIINENDIDYAFYGKPN